MKKLLALGVSNILYWRQLLPEEAFGERMVGGKFYYNLLPSIYFTCNDLMFVFCWTQTQNKYAPKYILRFHFDY